MLRSGAPRTVFVDGKPDQVWDGWTPGPCPHHMALRWGAADPQLCARGLCGGEQGLNYLLGGGQIRALQASAHEEVIDLIVTGTGNPKVDGFITATIPRFVSSENRGLACNRSVRRGVARVGGAYPETGEGTEADNDRAWR